MKAFIKRHPKAFYASLVIHFILFVLLMSSTPDTKQKVMKVNLVTLSEDGKEVKSIPKMKTFAVDSKQIQKQLARIKKEDQDKLKQRQKLAKQTEKEKNRLAYLKKKKKIEQNKLANEKAKAKKAAKATKLAQKKHKEAEKKRKQEETKAKKFALEVKNSRAEKEKVEAEALQARLLKEQEEEEAILQKDLAEAEAKQRKTAKKKEMQNLKEVYISNIASAVKLNWKTKSRISDKAECIISITQTPNGNVSSVKLHDCNKYATKIFKKNAEKAVYRSEPLPKPPVKELFERKIDFIFKP